MSTGSPTPFPEDIYSEPSDVDVHTLRNLGPLTRMAGVWQGPRGLDVKPKAEGPKKQAYVERLELQPIDPQTNGPQLLYGLRYFSHVTKPEQRKTYHDQVGYWLWEPATGTVIHTLTIPRGQTAMAVGQASADAKTFELVATRGLETFGICSVPFLEYAFKTVEFRIKVTINDDGTWTYDEDTVLMIRGRDEPFHHTDRNTLAKIAEPTPNPLAHEAAASGS
ncbi:MAG TPA: heme-binding beta-barrel domain-containing protein [Burkholderiaceae bacterium]|nr:heme-binding beta-barrel domain-containing protein [Burkholderiaceae bacterium]